MDEQDPDRPLRQQTLAGLSALMHKSKDDVKALKSIEAELSHRTTNGARQTLSELRIRLAELARQEGAVAVPATRASASRTHASGGARNAMSPAYDSLRLLISEEAEVLARWGLAPGLPADLEGRFLEVWEQLLSGTGECHGRSIDDLRKTRAKLSAIRSERDPERSR